MKKLQVKLTALLTTVLLAASATAFVACSDEDEEAERKGYSITIESSSNGTVTANKSRAETGETVTLTVTPSDGYELDTLVVKYFVTTYTAVKPTQDATDTAKYTFTMPESSVTVAATFITTTPATTKAKPDAVGDVVLNDGTAIAAENANSINKTQKTNAVAVIFYVGTGAATSGSNDNILGNKTLGVGLQNTQGEDTTTMAWARYTDSSDKANGYGKTIDSIGCSKTETKPSSGSYYTYTTTYYNTTYYVTGDFDGSDNYTALKTFLANSANGTTDDTGISGNYPAFEWADAYGTNHSLTGDYASGWYLPSAVELYILYTNRTIVNKSLTATGGTKLSSNSAYGDAYYWSSNLENKDNAYFSALARTINFSSYGVGDIESDIESNSTYHSVCAIREF